MLEVLTATTSSMGPLRTQKKATVGWVFQQLENTGQSTVVNSTGPLQTEMFTDVQVDGMVVVVVVMVMVVVVVVVVVCVCECVCVCV